MARRVGPGLWEWVLICTLAVAALGMGYGAGDVYANGWCQSCNAAKAGTPCPTGGACTLFENICAIGACNAPSAATGTCVWGPIFSGCYGPRTY